MLIPEAKLKLVPQDFAQTIAEKFASSSFINKKSKSNTRSTNSTPVLSNKIQNEITFKDHSNSAAFYIFNFVDDAGFLIVSADFNVNPILAYIDNGNFKNDSKVPRGFTDWINKATENQCL
ncbi:MAG: Spi family protease inhibitor [Ginsengibacter sp.]